MRLIPKHRSLFLFASFRFPSSSSDHVQLQRLMILSHRCASVTTRYYFIKPAIVGTCSPFSDKCPPPPPFPPQKMHCRSDQLPHILSLTLNLIRAPPRPHNPLQLRPTTAVYSAKRPSSLAPISSLGRAINIAYMR